MRLLLLVPPGPDPEAAGAEGWGRAMRLPVRTARMAAGPPPPDIAPDEVAWCHAGNAVPALPPAWCEALAAWIDGGGRLLLTLLAAPLAQALGAPGPGPHVALPAPWRDEEDPRWAPDFRDWPDYPHLRGAQGWGRHPLFDGLGRGAYTWKATQGEPVARCSYRQPRWPAGEVLAVERSYVALHAEEAVAWSHAVGKGRLLCLGANVSFGASARALSAQRDRYVLNALALCDRRRAWGGAWKGAQWPAWPARAGMAPEPTAPGSADVPVGMPELQLAGSALPPPPLAALTELPTAPLALEGAARRDAAFTLAGRRALVVGHEREGVREAWLHPLCVLSDGVALSVDDETVMALDVQVAPQRLCRTVRDGGGRQWREVVAVDPALPIVRYEVAPLDPAAGGSVRLELSLRVRLQWPMPADAMLPLTARWRQADGRAVVCVGSAHSPLDVRLAGDGVASCQVVPRVRDVRVTLVGAPGTALRLALCGDVRGAAALAPAWRALRDESLAAMLARGSACDRARTAATVRLATADGRLDEAWEWAKARLAAFVIEVPDVGTGLAAGYAASRPGWGDSRPGYAWFFGRDACWSGDALLAAGLFDEARVALEFLASTAELTGQVAHEVTTSGVAHYDAADATPLWLRFVARYADWTGDLATVRTLWPAVVRAVQFVCATDRDDDGLPDNTGVGHGWIESGPLGGGALTSYTASIWIDALRRIGPLATRLGARELAAAVDVALPRAEAAFERRLRDPATGRVILQRRLADGAQASVAPVPGAGDVADTDVTALSAVPILLGVDGHASADRVVEELSRDDFAAPWGVRLISRQDARYRARGYHVGAVWPLYTGWVSLAAYARRQATLGWRHLRAVTDAAFHRERGAFDEVLDGDTGAGAGVCPDQAWSAAMVITPFIEGMLGLVPCAPEGRCALAPQWPSHWPSATVTGLRVGQSRFSLAMRREGASRRYTFTLESGAPLTVALDGDGDQPGTLRQGAPVAVRRAAPAAAPEARDARGSGRSAGGAR